MVENNWTQLSTHTYTRVYMYPNVYIYTCTCLSIAHYLFPRPPSLNWSCFHSVSPGNSPQRTESDLFNQIILPCLVPKSCLTLCDPMDCGPSGPSIHGILQMRILEWVALPTQGSNPPLLCLLHWYVDSLPLSHQRSPDPTALP